MDGLQLFRKLGVGAKFDFKRFHKDAETLKIVRPKPEQSQQKYKSSNALDFFGDQKTSSQQIIRKRKLSGGSGVSESSDESSDSDDDEEADEDEDEDETSSDAASDKDSGPRLMADMAGSVEESNVTKKAKKKRKKSAAKLAELKQEQINHFRRVQRIHVYGSDVPDPCSTFTQLQEDYKLDAQLVENIHSAGYKDPTAIQTQAIPAMLHRRELLACAPTGSGKTMAFIIPILHHLQGPRRKGFRALILAPTRELAKQIQREFSKIAEGKGFRIHYIEKASTAAKKFGPKSAQKFDILVTTPNRLVYMLEQDPPVISLNNIEWLVVDESDKLFEEGKQGFRDQLGKIYKACQGKDVRRAMFSATFAHEVEEWCRLNLDNVLQVYIGARNSANETVKQELVFVGSESGKLLAVRDIVRKGLTPPVLIFVQSKDRAKELFHELIYDGINVDVMHADRTQTQRDNIMSGFRSGRIWVLICTDLMGRGIDFKGVNLVINYDFPTSAISYIHRIGRTGRAGREGRAVTLFTEEDTSYLRSIANVMREAGCTVPDYMLHMKKPNKKERRKLSKSAPQRETIRTIPKQEIQQAKKNRKFLKKKFPSKLQNESPTVKRMKKSNQRDSNESNKKDSAHRNKSEKKDLVKKKKKKKAES